MDFVKLRSFLGLWNAFCMTVASFGKKRKISEEDIRKGKLVRSSNFIVEKVKLALILQKAFFTVIAILLKSDNQS